MYKYLAGGVYSVVTLRCFVIRYGNCLEHFACSHGFGCHIDDPVISPDGLLSVRSQVVGLELDLGLFKTDIPPPWGAIEQTLFSMAMVATWLLLLSLSSTSLS